MEEVIASMSRYAMCRTPLQLHYSSRHEPSFNSGRELQADTACHACRPEIASKHSLCIPARNDQKLNKHPHETIITAEVLCALGHTVQTGQLCTFCASTHSNVSSTCRVMQVLTPQKYRGQNAVALPCSCIWRLQGNHSGLVGCLQLRGEHVAGKPKPCPYLPCHHSFAQVTMGMWCYALLAVV